MLESYLRHNCIQDCSSQL